MTTNSRWLLAPLLACVAACAGGSDSTSVGKPPGKPAPVVSAQTTPATPAASTQKATAAAATETSGLPSPTTLTPGAAGVCGRAVGADITFSTSRDGVPIPRCSYGSLNQRLVIDNTLPTGTEVRLSTGQRLYVPAGQRRAFAGTMSDLVTKTGDYYVRLGPASNAELLIDR